MPQTDKKNKQTAGISTPKKVLLSVFLGFIAVFFALICTLAKHEGELSPTERRVLAKAPNASFSNILGGSFSKEVDSWLEDHFPARNFFVALYSYINRFTGRNAAEDIVLGKNDRLFTAPVEMDEASIETNITKLRGFIEANSLKTTGYIIPTAGSLLDDELPKLHLEYHDDEIIARFHNALSDCMTPISARDVLLNEGDASSLYYRTDHHLTMRGSYASYVAICAELGLTPTPESEFTKTSYEFYGTSYGRSGLFMTPPDTLETWVAPYDASLAVTTVDGKTETEYVGAFDSSRLLPEEGDKYAAYLYSNHGITRIVNNEAADGCLLVLKDSYGNAIVPFLAAHYHTIIMIDTRSLYYTPSMPSPSTLCEEFGIEDFVIIVGLDTVASGTLDLLR